MTGKSLFILGAGASKDAGAPLMFDFIDRAEDILRSNSSDIDASAFRSVLSARSNLQAVHSKAKFDISNLESIFTAFEMGKILQKVPGTPPEEIDNVIRNLKILIAQTLEQSIKFPLARERPGLEPTLSYRIFAQELIEPLSKKSQTAVLTFNYDIALDFAFSYNGILFDYSLQGHNDSSPLLYHKLHGSLNWFYDRASKAVAEMPIRNILHKMGLMTMRSGSQSRCIPVSDLLRNYITENKLDAEPSSLIVPPSWNKADHHQNLTKVWSSAAKALEQAENIFVLGFSLPDTDSFFKHLFALGATGDRILRKFWVYNPDKNVDAKFRGILGDGAIHRYHFEPMTFRDAIDHIKKSLNL